jgi:hypothetical protein
VFWVFGTLNQRAFWANGTTAGAIAMPK